MTFDEWKKTQPWLNPVPEELSVVDLNAVWRAAKEDDNKILKNILDNIFGWRTLSHQQLLDKLAIIEKLLQAMMEE